jgi:hypothetical protein
MTFHRDVQPVWQDPFVINLAMGSRHGEATLELKEEIAQVAALLLE